MIVFLLVGVFVVLGGGAIYWGYVFWPLLRHGDHLGMISPERSFLLSFPLVFILLAILRSDSTQLLAVLSPPAGLIVVFYYLNIFFEFVWPLLIGASVVYVLSSIAFYRFSSRLFLWQTVVALLAGSTAFLLIGEFRTNALQKALIEKMGFECITYRYFTESISAAGNEFQSDYHTAGQIGRDVYGWSYKEFKFYEVPESVAKNLPMPCEYDQK